MNEQVVQDVTVDEQNSAQNLQDQQSNALETVFIDDQQSHLTPEVQKLQHIKKDLHLREQLCEQIENLTDVLETATSDKLEELKQQWQAMAAIPPEYMEILEKRFQAACQSFVTRRQQAEIRIERQQQLKGTVELLCRQIGELLPVEDGQWQSREKEFNSLRKKWDDLDLVGLDFDDDLAQFSAACQQFSQQKSEYYAQQQEALTKLEEDYKQQLENLKTLFDNDEHLKSQHHDIKELKHRWHSDKKQLKKHCPNLVHEMDQKLKEYFEKLSMIFQEADWQRWEHYTIKEDLIKVAEQLQQESNLFEVSHKLKELRDKWKEVGSVPREKADEQWNRFNDICNGLYEKCHQFYEQLDHERADNYGKKVALCEKVEALNHEKVDKNHADAVKHIQDEWKQIGPVPKEKDHELWERFNQSCNAFFEKRRAYLEQVKLEQGHNKEAKQKLCQKAKQLIDLDWKEGFQLIHELRDEWKAVHPAKREDEQHLWQQFNESIDTFYQKIEEQRPQNLEKKQDLCNKVIELLTDLPENVHYKTITEDVNELLEAWKQIGPVPKDKEDVLWQQFNEPVQKFFDQKRAFYDHLKSEKETNLTQKKEIISQIEEVINHNHNWNEAADNIKQLQARWKQVGPVPREHDKMIWQQYNELCNSFFNKRRDFFNNQKHKKSENLKTKIDLCVRLEHIAGISSPEQDINKVKAMSLEEELKFAIMDNSIAPRLSRKEAMDEVKRIQREWKEIGPVPRSDDQRIYQRYRRACDAFFGKRHKPHQ